MIWSYNNNVHMSYMLMSAAHRHRTSVFYCVHHNALYYVNTSTNQSDSDLDGRLHTVCSPRLAPILIMFVHPCLKVVMCDRVDLFTRKLYIAAHHVVINARITAFRGRARVVITLRRPSSHMYDTYHTCTSCHCALVLAGLLCAATNRGVVTDSRARCVAMSHPM